MARVLHVTVRHRERCPDRRKGRFWPKCACQKHCEGVLLGKRQRKMLDTCDWNKAEELVKEMERVHGIFERKRITQAVQEWRDAWQIGEATRAKYSRFADRLLAWAEKSDIKAVEDITLADLNAFYSERKIGPLSKVKEIQIWRGLFNFCRDNKWCHSNPALKLKPPKGLKPNRVIPYTADEIGAMIAAAGCIGNKNPVERDYVRRRARAMILLLWQTGLRIGDAYKLPRAAVKNGILTLHTEKNSRPIRRTLSQELRFALDALPAAHQDESSGKYFFWTGHQGKAGRSTVHAVRMLQPVFREAGIVDGHAHRFRHTLATQMLATGSTMADVAVALGSTVAVCEKHYGKYDQARHERADQRILIAQNRVTPTAQIDEDPLKSTPNGGFAGGEGGIRTVSHRKVQ